MSTANETVLVVEDNEDDLFALKRALKKAALSHPLRVASNGCEAIEYLRGDGCFADRAQFPLPVLMLLDLKMPVCDGFEVLAWMRERPELAAITVVVLTGSDEVRDHQRAHALGARSYLVKPPTVADIHGIMNAVETLWSGAGRATARAKGPEAIAGPGGNRDSQRG